MRLIDADALKEYFSYSARLCEDIDKFPTIERKKGKWYSIGNTGLAACKCGFITKRLYNYCPNCGADMRGQSYETG